MVILRTIRNGRVKIKNKFFYPEEKYAKYDGRFEGKKWGFGTYLVPGSTKTQIENFVCLWGTELEFKAKSYDEIDMASKQTDPEYLKWQWWKVK